MDKQPNRYDGFLDVLGGQSPWSPITPPNVNGYTAPYNSRVIGNTPLRFTHSIVDVTELEELYIANGIAATIVDRPADECFSKRIEIEGDDDELMEDEYDRLAVSSTFANAVRWARLFGSSCILIMASDGGGWADELNLDRLDTVEDLIVYDSRYIRPTERLYTDPANPLFGKPEYYFIRPQDGAEFEVHETRIIPFTGDPLPLTNHKTNTLPWWQGKPVLLSCKNDIQRLVSAYHWTIKLLERKQQGIYGMEGLGELFSQSMDDIVTKRINMVDHVRNILNSVVIDSKDTYDIKNLGLDGLDAVISELQIAICASSKFPSVILFGKSVSSLNVTGAGELENFYSMCDNIRHRICLPNLERLTSILWLQRSMKSKIPDNWVVKFPPLWQPTEKEQADTEAVKATAQATEVNSLITLMDAQIITPEELRKIIANKYADYDLPETVDSSGFDIQYAESTGGAPGAPDNVNANDQTAAQEKS
jgi:phage-related protein (TIGR01555 family)